MLDYEDVVGHGRREMGNEPLTLSNQIAKALQSDDYSFILSLADQHAQQQHDPANVALPLRSGGGRCMRKAFMPCACAECLSRQRGRSAAVIVSSAPAAPSPLVAVAGATLAHAAAAALAAATRASELE